jgi:hypothetical protein
VRDHHGDQITEKALRKLAKSALGMSIFLDHEYRIKDLFGHVERARIVKTEEVDEKTGNPIFDMRLGVVVQKKNPEAVQVWDMLQPTQAADGSLKPGAKLGMSIGAMVPEGGARFDKAEGGRYIVDDLDIVETSIVTMPANPRSWVDYAFKSAFGSFPEKATQKRLDLVKEMSVTGDGTIESYDEEKESPGTGEPMEGVEAAADGTETTLTSDGEVEAEPVAQTEPDATGDTPAEGSEDEMAVEKAKVSIWETPDGAKTTVIDTGRSRPKGEGDSPAQDSDDPETAESSTTSKANELDHPLVKSLTGQLAAMKERHETETIELQKERDAALAVAESVIEQAGSILKALEEKPVGRKTASGNFADADLQKARVDLDSLAGILDPDVLKMLKKG